MIEALMAEVEALKRQVASIAAGGGTFGRQGAPFIVVPQASHGMTNVGTPIRITSGGWVKSQANTAANAIVDAVVGAVLSTDAFVAVFPGHLLVGLSGRTKGTRYFLDAATAGGVVTTAPAIAVPIYDALSATAAVLCASGGSGGVAPTEDGTVWCAKSDLSGGEWVLTVDIGRNAVGKAGKIQILSPDASGVAIEIDAALVTATGKKLTIREEDACDSSGTPKKRLILASNLY